MSPNVMIMKEVCKVNINSANIPNSKFRDQGPGVGNCSWQHGRPFQSRNSGVRDYLFWH